MHREDKVFLAHIRDACLEAIEIMGGTSLDEMRSDKMQRYALLKLLEVIGEASMNVSPELKLEHPEIPWKKMVGLRNRLVHGYMDVDYSIIHETIVKDIPPLLSSVEVVLNGL